jgi:glycosyltransferase involved in cell wall biosynthesis
MSDLGKGRCSDVHDSTVPLHVVPLIYFYEADLTTPESLLDRYATIRPFAKALHAEGARITVVQRFHTNLDFWDSGIHFRFCADSCQPALRRWEIPGSFHSCVRAVCAPGDVPGPVQTAIHLNGLLYPLQLRALRKSLPPDCSVVVQHHADGPWPAIVRPLQRWGLRAADGFFFAAQDLAAWWLDHGLISKRQSIYPIMEGSNNFRRQGRVMARVRTKMAGNPVVLWVGRLIPLKDPLTVLEGFTRILQHLPKAKLYMAYGSSDMLPAVRERIAASKVLSEAVILLGKIEHSQLENIYNSSDYFVLGSHQEGSGFSLAEAMACGVVPVVTDIPSFRVMTDGGRVGACWRPGSPEAFADKFLEVMRQPLEQLSHEVHRFFQSQLSYKAIARDSTRAYREVIAARQNHA